MLTFCIVLCSHVCSAHGPTTCLGMITVTSNTAALDLRVGVGLLHHYIDLNDDGTVSAGEWDQTSDTMRLIAKSKLLVNAGETSRTAQRFDITITSGNEIKILADFDISRSPNKFELWAPFVMSLPGSPPAILGVQDTNNRIIRAASYTWFDKPLVVERTAAAAVKP